MKVKIVKKRTILEVFTSGSQCLEYEWSITRAQLVHRSRLNKENVTCIEARFFFHS
jgi:hypothetical protein